MLWQGRRAQVFTNPRGHGFLSRPISVDRYGFLYAGAQKNIGPAGVTAVMIREDFLQTKNPDLPTMLDYGTHTGKPFNTPPVFAVYIVEKVLRWIEKNGGLDGMVARNGNGSLFPATLFM